MIITILSFKFSINHRHAFSSCTPSAISESMVITTTMTSYLSRIMGRTIKTIDFTSKSLLKKTHLACCWFCSARHDSIYVCLRLPACHIFPRYKPRKSRQKPAPDKRSQHAGNTKCASEISTCFQTFRCYSRLQI